MAWTDLDAPNFSDLSGKNEGQVKINTGNSLKPTVTWGGGSPAPGVFQRIIYESALGFSAAPVTEWPENILTPQDSDIYDFVNDTFIENAVLGQVNFWRALFTFSGKQGNIAAGVEMKIENTLSGFMEEFITTLPRTATSGSFAIVPVTVADGNSLPAPLGTGQGYKFSLNSTDNMTVVLESLTRVTYQKNQR